MSASFSNPSNHINCRRRADRRVSTHPLAAELAQAVAQGAIELRFQPQFDCETGQVRGVEALARWSHPQQGEINGEELFCIAGGAGLSHDLSLHVLNRALVEASHWPERSRLSVNITAEDLAASGFLDSVAQALADSGIAPERLTLEITEQALVHDLEGSAERLHKLVELGVCIALDDFGAGFCNFRYLKKLPLQYLKLDRSMVEDIARDVRDLEILRGIIAMASALDLAVIAEGIEAQEQLDAVTREGCEGWQGFLGARPMAADSVLQYVSA
ncbi:EAL domain-containing protein [Alteraurantiacibacter aquimixticola]|nr:EAL domain-containing protein [Alteraurantiacibacter aquimixticola]